MRYFLFANPHKKILTRESLQESYPGNLFENGNLLCRQAARYTVENSFSSDTGKPRMLLLGTSQSAGSGADVLENTFFVKLHRKLHVRKPGLISLNISAPGEVPLKLLDKFRIAVKKFRPDIILINLGHNGHPDDYESAVETMVRENSGKRFS